MNDSKKGKAEKTKSKAYITCRKCSKKDHNANECPELAGHPAETGTALLSTGVPDNESDLDGKPHFQFLRNGNKKGGN